jgi:hypothetical protein
MFIFANPGQIYLRNGLSWVVDSINGNLVKSRAVDFEVHDIEILAQFNREVIAGLIEFPELAITANDCQEGI